MYLGFWGWYNITTESCWGKETKLKNVDASSIARTVCSRYSKIEMNQRDEAEKAVVKNATTNNLYLGFWGWYNITTESCCLSLLIPISVTGSRYSKIEMNQRDEAEKAVVKKVEASVDPKYGVKNLEVNTGLVNYCRVLNVFHLIFSSIPLVIFLHFDLASYQDLKIQTIKSFA